MTYKKREGGGSGDGDEGLAALMEQLSSHRALPECD